MAGAAAEARPHRPLVPHLSTYDVVVVGHGAAGLAASLTAREANPEARVLVLEAAPEARAGGNTRWSPSYMRMEAPDRLVPGFVEDFQAICGGRSDPRYVQRLADEALPTIAWLQRHGVAFDRPPNYFLTAAAPRIQPVGAGAAVVRDLARAARAAGIELRYETRAVALHLDAGRIAGIAVDGPSGAETIGARAVVLACGSFAADPSAKREHFGPGGESIRPISDGTGFNTGLGIRMAVAAGAATAGDWNGMHVEPVDPRSARAEAVVLVYPYGIVVDRDGRRFFDEGAGRVDETWETLARTIHFDAPGRIAYAIFDQALFAIPGYQRAVCTDVPPHEAPTIEALADVAGIPRAGLAATVAAYNAAATGPQERFDATRTDGLAATGIAPPKSNWARPIVAPPFVAYPLVAAICYPFGGIATNAEAEVIDARGAPIPGLYAAGEITGQFYGKAPGGTSVLRGLVFGRIAGERAARVSAAR